MLCLNEFASIRKPKERRSEGGRTRGLSFGISGIRSVRFLLLAPNPDMQPKNPHGNGSKQRQVPKTDVAPAAVGGAKEAYDAAIEKISAGIIAEFKCDEHDGRLCGKICGSREHFPYSNKHLLEHAQLIMSLLTKCIEMFYSRYA